MKQTDRNEIDNINGRLCTEDDFMVKQIILLLAETLGTNLEPVTILIVSRACMMWGCKSDDVNRWIAIAKGVKENKLEKYLENDTPFEEILEKIQEINLSKRRN